MLFGETLGQGEANVWYFGNKCGLQFPGGGTPVPKSSTSVGGSDIMESASSISDAAGNFLFGTNGSAIFSSDLVTRGSLPNGSNEQQAQGAMIIPVPGVSGEYFLSTVVSSCSAKPAYTNITVTGTTGNNITIGSKVDLEGGITQGQMVLPKTDVNGNLTDEFWLVHHQLGTDKFNVYSVTSTGINPSPVYKTAGPVIAGSCGDNTAYFKANACYDQFAYSYGSDVYLFDFDTETGDITFRNRKNVPNAYGIEFSKNGRHVYISTGTMNGQNPSVYEIGVSPGGMGSDLQGTPTHVMTLAQTARGGCLQMGPDGRIYCASFTFSGSGSYLGVISDPDNATGYNPQGVYLGSGLNIGMGLPAFITSLVSSVVDLKLGGVSAATTSICNNTTVLLSGEVNNNVAASADWEITDPSGGVSTYLSQNNFNHTFTGVGIHKVKITVKDACGRDKISLVDVKVEDKQIANATEAVCVSGKRLLTGTGGVSGNYKWYSGNPASGGVLLSIGATYQATAGSQIWVEPAGSITSDNTTVNDTRTASRSGNASGNTTIILGPGTSSINSFQMAYYHNYSGSTTPGTITLELRDASNNVIGTPITRVINNTGQWIGLTTLTFNPTDWNNLSAGTYTVVLTKSLPAAIQIGTVSGSYSLGDFSISGDATFKYNITNSSNVETSSVSCKEGKLINVSICCSQPTPGLTLSATSICEGGDITLTASTTATGTIVYEFSKGTTVLGTTTSPTNTYTLSNVSTTSSGSFTVQVLSSGSCSAPSVASTAVTLTVISNPDVPIATTPVSLCENATAGALSATALSGHILQWYGTDATGGTASATAPVPVTTSTGTVNYYVSQKNTTTGCESLRTEISTTINANPSVPAVINPVNYCQNASATALNATALSGHTLQWYGTDATGGTASATAPTPVTTSTGSVKYYVSQKNITTSCESSREEITVTINPAPEARTVADTKACIGADATVVIPNVQSGVIYQVNGTGQEYSGTGDINITIQASVLLAGNNSFTITGMAAGCDAPVTIDNVSVMVLDKASESLDENLKWTDNVCEGKSFGILDMSSNGVNGYDWQVSPATATLSKNGLTSTLLFNGASSVTLTAIPSIDGFTCTTSNLTKTINLIPAYIPEILVASEDTICAGDTITFTVISANQGNTLGYTLQYSTSLGIEEMKNMHPAFNSFVFRFNQPGDFSQLVIAATPQYACGIQDAIKTSVTVIDRPHANAGDDEYLDNYATIDLKGDLSTPLDPLLYTYSWSSPDPNAGIVDPSSVNTNGIPSSRNTQYILSVESRNERSCVSIDVKEVIIDIKLNTPNVFSPNGDGIHDTFELGNIELFPNAVLYIYNQWGELVFKSQPGYPGPWDGRRDSKACTVGTYYYVLELNEDGYKPIVGSVSIVR